MWLHFRYFHIGKYCVVKYLYSKFLGTPPPTPRSNFLHFHAVFGTIGEIVGCLPLRYWHRRPSGKSLIRPCCRRSILMFWCEGTRIFYLYLTGNVDTKGHFCGGSYYFYRPHSYKKINFEKNCSFGWLLIITNIKNMNFQNLMLTCSTSKLDERCFFNFGGYKSFLWGHSCPCFWLLVISLLGFKARVDSLIRTWQRCTCYTFPEPGSQGILFHIPASRYWWDSKPGSILPHSVRLGRHSADFRYACSANERCLS